MCMKHFMSNYILLCPIGFTLQNRICDCDPLLLPDIDICHIKQSVIRRPVTMWITAHVQSNDTKYLTGNCPMDYCLPYLSNVLLTNPNTQCQFNRTGVVFESSRCMKCTNLRTYSHCYSKHIGWYYFSNFNVPPQPYSH